VREDVQVVAHLLRVLVGVDAEVAEVTPLPAERDVEIEPERHARNRRRVEGRHTIGRHCRGIPRGERRIGGNEVAANFSVIVQC
jgi:hypothetical protein